MSANFQELAIALSTRAQSDIATPQTSDFIRITKTNRAAMTVDLKTESDADDLGKDDEFATDVFLTNYDVNGRFESFGYSEWLGYVFANALGNNTADGTGGHTATFQDPITSGIELPYFSMIEAIRQSAGTPVLNRLLIGLSMGAFTVKISSGPGRRNVTCQADIAGSGNFQTTGVPTLPTLGTLHRLDAASAAVTILGNDYVSLKRTVDFEFGVRNNPDLPNGFFPGSGLVNGAAVRGRIEFAKRQPYFNFRVRLAEGSDEFDKLIAQTEGTAVLSLTGAAGHDMTATYARMRLSAAVVGEDAGRAIVQCTGEPLKDAGTGKVLTTVVHNGITTLANE